MTTCQTHLYLLKVEKGQESHWAVLEAVASSNWLVLLLWVANGTFVFVFLKTLEKESGWLEGTAPECPESAVFRSPLF